MAKNKYWRLEIVELEYCITYVFRKKPSIQDLEKAVGTYLDGDQINRLLDIGDAMDPNYIRTFNLSEKEFDN